MRKLQEPRTPRELIARPRGSFRAIFSQATKLKPSEKFFSRGAKIAGAADPAGIDRKAQGDRLDLFLAQRQSWNLQKHFFSRGVKIAEGADPAGIDRLGQGNRLDRFLAQRQSWNLRKNFWFLEVRKLQRSRTPRKLIARRWGIV